MKQKALLTLIICSSSWLSGCDTALNNPFHMPSSMMTSVKHTNSDIVSDLIAINHNEIAASKLAEHKAMNHDVRKFAHSMVHAHSKNLHQTLRLSKKIHAHQDVNNVSRHLQSEGAKEIASLKELNGSSFDKYYIEAMINDHKAALRFIDHTLMAHSSNALLTKHLEATRQDVKMHLQHAEVIQKQLQR